MYDDFEQNERSAKESKLVKLVSLENRGIAKNIWDLFNVTKTQGFMTRAQAQMGKFLGRAFNKRRRRESHDTALAKRPKEDILPDVEQNDDDDHHNDPFPSTSVEESKSESPANVEACAEDTHSASDNKPAVKTINADTQTDESGLQVMSNGQQESPQSTNKPLFSVLQNQPHSRMTIETLVQNLSVKEQYPEFEDDVRDPLLKAKVIQCIKALGTGGFVGAALSSVFLQCKQYYPIGFRALAPIVIMTVAEANIDYTSASCRSTTTAKYILALWRGIVDPEVDDISVHSRNLQRYESLLLSFGKDIHRNEYNERMQNNIGSLKDMNIVVRGLPREYHH